MQSAYSTKTCTGTAVKTTVGDTTQGVCTQTVPKDATQGFYTLTYSPVLALTGGTILTGYATAADCDASNTPKLAVGFQVDPSTWRLAPWASPSPTHTSPWASPSPRL